MVSQPVKNKDSLTYSPEGFVHRIPVLNRNKFIAWGTVDTVLFYPYCHGEGTDYTQMYALALNTPYTTHLDEDAVWVNRFLARIRRPNSSKRVYLDNQNPDFYTFRHAIAQHLGAPLHSVAGPFDRDEAYASTEAQLMAGLDSGAVRIKPAAGSLDVQVVYDRYGRTTYDELGAI